MSRDSRQMQETVSPRERSLNKVSREKYEIVKDKLNKWIKECENIRERLEVYEEKNIELLQENNDLKIHINEIKNSRVDLDGLENENINIKKEIRILRKENKNIIDKNRDILYKLERDLILKDSTIQRLEESKKDLKEMYLELKEDFREQTRWSRVGMYDTTGSRKKDVKD